jgi:hypothetical protein
MNDEQNTPGNGSETGESADNSSTAANNASQSQPVSGGDDAAPQDDYYAVDHAKKDVISTIGDGEMRDEGLVGAGEVAPDIQSSQDRLSDEQDVAEFHDSEG